MFTFSLQKGSRRKEREKVVGRGEVSVVGGERRMSSSRIIHCKYQNYVYQQQQSSGNRKM